MIPPPDHHKTAGAAVPGAEVREPLVPREQTLRRRPKRAPLAPEGLGFVELGAMKPEPRLGQDVAARRALGEPKVLAPVRQPRGHVVKPAVAHAARVLDPPPRGFTGTCARFAVARRRGCTWGGHGQQAAAAWWHRSRAAVGCGGGDGTDIDHCVASKSAIPASSSSPVAGCQWQASSAASGAVRARTRSLSRDGAVIVVAEPRDLPEADLERLVRRHRNCARVVDALAHREQRRAHPHRALEQRGAQVCQAPDLAAVRRKHADVLRHVGLGCKTGGAGGQGSAPRGGTGAGTPPHLFLGKGVVDRWVTLKNLDQA